MIRCPVSSLSLQQPSSNENDFILRRANSESRSSAALNPYVFASLRRSSFHSDSADLDLCYDVNQELQNTTRISEQSDGRIEARLQMSNRDNVSCLSPRQHELSVSASDHVDEDLIIRY